MANGNYISNINRTDSVYNPIAQQLIFGGGGIQGLLPQAITATNRTFFNEDGTPKVFGQRVAGFNPDQTQAFGMTRDMVGMRDPYFDRAEDLFGQGFQDYSQTLGNVGDIYGESLADYTAGLDELGGIYRDIGSRRFDPTDTQRFQNPFEDQVVQQTISDVMDQAEQREQGEIAGNIGRGGESAFGSRAKLGAEERLEALGRGLGESVAGIRRGGFDTAMTRAEQDFARNIDLAQSQATGLGGLFGSRFGAQRGFGSDLRGLGSDLLGARTGFANQLTGLGDARFGAGQQDIQNLLGIGSTQQGFNQRVLDAQMANQRLGQQAYLNQLKALQPFYSTAISQAGGPSGISTSFIPRPSPLQAGLATGLSAFGALGNYFGQENM
jgi:hypothetical protein